MKKILGTVLACVAMLSIAGCGTSDEIEEVVTEGIISCEMVVDDENFVGTVGFEVDIDEEGINSITINNVFESDTPETTVQSLDALYGSLNEINGVDVSIESSETTVSILLTVDYTTLTDDTVDTTISPLMPTTMTGTLSTFKDIKEGLESEGYVCTIK